MTNLVGLTVKEAEAIAAGDGYVIRVIEEDGESVVHALEFKIMRLNVKVADGKITEVVDIG